MKKNKTIVIGVVFGRWKIVGNIIGVKGKRRAHSRCSCGTERDVLICHLLSGKTKSCGCLMREIVGERSFKHGLTNTTEYGSWQRMRSRCLLKTDKDFQAYGGQGITICDRWLNSFESFLADMGKKPNKNYTLDRKDVFGNYEPENCRWASREEQARNRSNNVLFNGECATPASRRLGGVDTLVASRIRRGWSIEEAFSTIAQNKHAKTT